MIVYTDREQMEWKGAVVQVGDGFPVEVVRDAGNWKQVVCEAIKNSKLYAEKTDIILIADEQKVREELETVLNAGKVAYKLLTGSQTQD